MNQKLNSIISITNTNLNITLQRLQHQLARNAAYNSIYGIYTSQSQFEFMSQHEYNPYNIVALIWVPIIKRDTRASFENYMKRSGMPNYNITAVNITIVNGTRSTTFIPAPERDDYLPIAGLIPLTPAILPIMGFDLGYINETRIYFDAIDRRHGDFLLYNRPTNFSEKTVGVTIGRASCSRENNLALCINDTTVGYHLLVIDMQKLIHASLPEYFFNETGVKLIVLNIYPNGTFSPLYVHRDIDISNKIIPEGKYRLELTFHVLGKIWKIYFYFTEEYINSITSNRVTITLISVTLTFVIIDIISIVLVVMIIILKENKTAIANKYMIANQMMGYVNHEIRNPLNAIIGLVDLSCMELEELFESLNGKIETLNGLMDRNASAKKIMKWASDMAIPEKTVKSILSNLNTASKSCLLLRHIVNDILDVKKLEENKLVLEWSEFYLSELVADIKKIIAPKFVEKPEITFITKYEDVLVRSDKHRLIQLLLNLLTNAIKFTHAGTVELIIETDIDKNLMTYKVKDTGIGIPDDKKHIIFKPFEQIHGENSRYGVGLGLNLSRLLVKNMQGEIGFESQQGVGSTFWFTLKLHDGNESKNSEV
jgi:signal transduction histidine kinase